MIKCILCESQNLELIGNHPSFKSSNVFLCNTCQFGFASPLPSEAELSKFYEQDIYSKEWRTQQYLGAKDMASSDRRAQAQWNFCSPWMDQRPANLKALEIGSSIGSLLKILCAHHFECHGYEPSKDAAQIATSRLQGMKATIFNFPADFSKMEKGHYDFISLSHVLEHLPNPVEQLSHLLELLKPTGVLFIEVPNEIAMNLKMSLQPALNPISIRQGHLYFYGLNSLQKISQRAGFIVEKIFSCGPSVKWDSAIKSGRKHRYRHIRYGALLLYHWVRFVRSIHSWLSSNQWDPDGLQQYHQNDEGLWIRAVLRRPQ